VRTHDDLERETLKRLRRPALRLVAVVWLLAMPQVASAKCGWLVFQLRGELEVQLPSGAEVQLFAEPDANAKQPAAIINGRVVEGTLRFDSLRGYSWWRGHNCSRQPKRIGLRVVIDGVERYSASRRFPAEFDKRSDFEWANKEPFRITVSAP
jgi:hypothetical protein